jgi:Txe/YoeB family toxin of toxin-antitoxin system
MYEIVLTKQAVKDAAKLERHNLKSKAMNLIRLIRTDPFAYPPPFEHLGGKMKGLLSRRINRHHRLVYEVFEAEKVIKIYRMWTHYE